jgi:hypothetical protein
MAIGIAEGRGILALPLAHDATRPKAGIT